ncbi:MAG: hypothetical protein UY48_C0003G0054 [Candidatus Gottesmanbacteria bacterium GW2011_GWB1_49_7]|uniref:Uncharacterized protein n=1 Tax=Candidatus Gottesmanbacteria bacterium GW2011_GWB1_49_7 TaxID=1618448 RepID=A0A0G1YE52_9BACT|nr:MAG: hypothetical protein UY48_C0003G0054 [Candidatus Gottesmanbacteria bacterium GW2011_GWB1_49_7]
MKKENVVLGHVYAVRVGRDIRPVKLEGTHYLCGWVGRNLQTGRQIRVKTAARLRYDLEGIQ